MDRYLASLRAPSPTYEDPYAYWGGTRPALQYGLPPEYTAANLLPSSAPYTGGNWGADFTANQATANALPGGPRPSTPSGTILPPAGPPTDAGYGPAPPLPPQWGGPAARPTEAQLAPGGWDLGRFYNAANDRASGYNGENGLGRFNRWVGDALNYAQSKGRQVNPDDLREIARGGIAYAEANGFGPSGFNLQGATPNTLNPGQAVEFLAAGGRPNQYHTDQRGLTTGAGGDPYQAAADHLTRQLSGGSTGGQTMATPGYDPGLGGGTAGVPRAGGGGGGLSSYNAGQLLFDPQALQAYIAEQAGTPIGRNTFRDQYTRQAIVPLIQASLESLTGLGGETTADTLGQNLQHYLSLLGGQGGFGAIRGEAAAALKNPNLWSNLALLPGGDQEIAQRLNQLIGLGTAGTSEIYSRAMQGRAQNALTQRHRDQALLPQGAETSGYTDYFRSLPWLSMLTGGA